MRQSAWYEFGDGTGDRAIGPVRDWLVLGAQHYPCRRSRIFHRSCGAGWSHRHCHDRIETAHELLRRKSSCVSTNPIAIAAPNPSGGKPIILDMSTSAVSLGKIMAAKDAGRSIPIGWGVDANGVDVTDPKSVEFRLLMAGAKGSGLSLMIEVLTSVLISNPLITPALLGNGTGAFNGVAIAINVNAFGDPQAFHRDIAKLGHTIKALPRAEGVTGILLPGERGYAVAANAEAEGVMLETGTAARLIKLAESYNVTAPEALLQI